MRAVVEEIESGMVCFIPDNGEEAIYIETNKVTHSMTIGDVVELVYEDGKLLSLTPLKDEKERRLEANRLKREKLLEREENRKQP